VKTNDNSAMSYKIDTMMSIHNLPAEIIWEIFDRNPKAGLKLARTNKWLNKVLKDKIKKHRQLIKECNSAAICYSNSSHNIIIKEYKKTKKNNNFEIGFYVSYFHCINCFRSFEYDFYTLLFSKIDMRKVRKTGILLCEKCILNYPRKKLTGIDKFLGEDSDSDSDDSDDSYFKYDSDDSDDSDDN